MTQFRPGARRGPATRQFGRCFARFLFPSRCVFVYFLFDSHVSTAWHPILANINLRHAPIQIGSTDNSRNLFNTPAGNSLREEKLAQFSFLPNLTYPLSLASFDSVENSLFLTTVNKIRNEYSRIRAAGCSYIIHESAIRRTILHLDRKEEYRHAGEKEGVDKILPFAFCTMYLSLFLPSLELLSPYLVLPATDGNASFHTCLDSVLADDFADINAHTHRGRGDVKKSLAK